MKILYVTATPSEAEVLKNVKDISWKNGIFKTGMLRIYPLVAGIGSVQTIWNMMHWISLNGKPDMAINGGIAGSFTDLISTGEVVIPVNECFADLGIEDINTFLTLAEAHLAGPEDFPFVNGWIPADRELVSRFNYLKPVKSITVNTATGSETTIGRLVEKFKPDIETMEGASFFYLCRREAIPFMAVRSISNRIEPRNKASWNIKLALDNLAARLYDVFLTLDSVR